MPTDQPDVFPSLRPGDSYGDTEHFDPDPSGRPHYRRRIILPIVFFAATCAATFLVGGLAFSLALMSTLTAHELGHFLQARRYGVPASLPYFIPMPFHFPT
jgi:hypothetical protein